GLNRRSSLLATGLLSLSLAFGVAIPVLLDRPAPIGLLFNLATMFVGTVIYRVYSRESSNRAAAAIVALAVGTMFLTLYSSFWGKDEPGTGGTRSFLPMLTAWLGAYGVFLLFYRIRHLTFPRSILHIGLVSYSM